MLKFDNRESSFHTGISNALIIQQEISQPRYFCSHDIGYRNTGKITVRSNTRTIQAASGQGHIKFTLEMKPE